MKKTLTCIICPKGCTLHAEISGNSVTVSGNTCKKGQQYAVNECLHPVRTVTATIRVANRENTMVSVKTVSPIPKDNMLEVMALLRNTTVQAPITTGQIALRDVFGSDVVFTKTIP